MRRKTFQYIESEVYDLHDTLKKIKLKELEIIHPFDEEQNDPGVFAGSNSVRVPGDPTGKTASLLVEERQLARMRNVTNAIVKIFNNLIEEKQKVIKLYYWDKPGKLTWEGVGEETNTSRRTAMRWRKDFIESIASELGEH